MICFFIPYYCSVGYSLMADEKFLSFILAVHLILTNGRMKIEECILKNAIDKESLKTSNSTRIQRGREVKYFFSADGIFLSPSGCLFILRFLFFSP